MNPTREIARMMDKRAKQPQTVTININGSGPTSIEGTHNHDDRYYTEGEVDTLLSLKSDTTHDHDSDYADIAHTHTLEGLSDVPPYAGQAGKVIKVNATENGVEYGEATGGASTFTSLTDAPASYTGQSGKVVAVKSTEDGLEFVDSGEATNGLPSGGTAGQILSKVDGLDYNAQWVDAPSGGSGALNTSRIGLLLPVVPTGGLTAREAVWSRVVCLANCTVTSVKFPIYAVTGNMRLRVVEVGQLSGNATVTATVYTGTYGAVSTPPCVHEFAGISIGLSADKIYCFILESETGTTLQIDSSNNRAVLGHGSYLPHSGDLGGYTTRGSSTLTAYASSIVPVLIYYEM